MLNLKKINIIKQRKIVRDIDIRLALLKKLENDYKNDSNTRILQEFGLREGISRIDIAIVNGSLIGYEIKSEADTLERLSYQQQIYSEIFDRMVIIISQSHKQKIFTLIPSWWEIWLANESVNEITFHVLRKGKDNDYVNPYSIAQCLWRNEAMEILKNHGLSEGMNKARRSILWEKISNEIDCNELKKYVNTCLRARCNWNIVWSQQQDDD